LPHQPQLVVESGLTAPNLVGAVSRLRAVAPVYAGYAAVRAPWPPVTGLASGLAGEKPGSRR
jgi:hypothetical protein